MNKNTFVFWIVVLLTLTQGAIVFGQSSTLSTADKYLISARAGGVNFVQGSVAVARIDGRSGTLIRGDKLEIGDKVSTSVTSRAEVLLNPGSYMRLGADSAFEFVTTSLEDLQIRLTKGSAIFEVFATEDFSVTVLTPAGKISLIESGIYRVSMQGSSAKVAVTEGKAQLGDSKETIVKSSRVGTIGSSVAIAKFDKKNRDEMDEWSRSRSKDLAKATASLKQKDIRGSLISSFNSGRWGMYDSFGLWIYNPHFGGYSFLPFGNRWYSPYGFGFGYGMDWGTIPWWYRRPSTVYIPRNDQPSTAKQRRPGAITAPPYTAVEKQTQRQTRVYDQDNGAWPAQRGTTTRSAEPVYAPPVQAPVQRTEAAGRVRGVRPID